MVRPFRYKHSEATKLKISNSLKNRPEPKITDEQKKKISDSLKGRTHNDYLLDTRINGGYAFLKCRDRNGDPIREHVLVAEKALDKPLPKGAVVHHVNGIKSDNRNSNLVICQDEAYHQRLHARMRKKLK